jgi:DNA helicase-2/ATP-dependent DNA helicase PcrA
MSRLDRAHHIRKLAPGDCVVLARTTKLLEVAAGALAEAGFETYVARRKSDFNAPLVRVMLHVLRLANARHDRDVLRRLCLAWGALTERTLEVEDVVANATLVGGDFLRAWADTAAVGAAGDAAALVARIHAALVDRLEFPGIVDWFLTDGWRPWSDEHDRELVDEMQTWQGLHGDIVSEHGADDLTLNAYLQEIALAPKAGRAGPNAVRCLTVHGSKGLEFKHVYLIGMAQEVLPSFHALKKGPKSRELEEERRNCFVAITRVMESLTLTGARQYNGWNKQPSQFLAEMGIDATTAI